MRFAPLALAVLLAACSGAAPDPAPSPPPEASGEEEERDAWEDEAVDFTRSPLHEAIWLASWVDEGPFDFLELSGDGTETSGTLLATLGTGDTAEGTWSVLGDVLTLRVEGMGSMAYRHVRTETNRLHFTGERGPLVLANYSG